MSAYELAQLNIATLLAPIDSPLLADFVTNLERINVLAERSPGYVWRFQTEEGDATALRPYERDDIIVNMSVWRDVDALRQFVFRSDHVEIMRRRGEWFARMAEAYVVLWWVPAGHRPTIEEAKQRLRHLQEQGPTARAFTFRTAFPPPDAEATATVGFFPDQCPAT